MKKFTFVILLVMGMMVSLNAQPRAIGARLGGNVEFSYQHQLNANMLDCAAGLTLGGNYFGVGATVIYDWVFPINSWTRQGEWNWYVGPGAGVGFMISNSESFTIPVSVNIGGQIGIEYQFGIPLNLSLDYRPMINLLGFSDNIWGQFFGFALGVRYRF